MTQPAVLTTQLLSDGSDICCQVPKTIELSNCIREVHKMKS